MKNKHGNLVAIKPGPEACCEFGRFMFESLEPMLKEIRDKPETPGAVPLGIIVDKAKLDGEDAHRIDLVDSKGNKHLVAVFSANVVQHDPANESDMPSVIIQEVVKSISHFLARLLDKALPGTQVQHIDDLLAPMPHSDTLN